MRFLERFRITRAPPTTADADRLAIRRLEQLGADLTQPRHVIHFLFFVAETDARRAAEQIQRADYDTTVVAPDDRFRDWRVRAEGTRVMGPTTVEGFRSWFEQVASDLGGQYDGWEAAPRP